MNNIFECSSSSDFIKFAQMYGRKKALSLRALSKRLNYASDRTVGMVAKGNRAMSLELAERLSDFLSLSELERRYVSLLTLKDKSNDGDEKLSGKLLKFKRRLNKYRTIKAADQEILANWFAFPVLEWVRVLSKDTGTVSRSVVFDKIRSVVSANELEQILKTWVDLGYLKETAQSIYALQTDEYLTTSMDLPSESIRKSHRSQLKRAIEAIDQQSVLEREYIAKTISVPLDKVESLKKRLREVLEEYTCEIEVSGKSVQEISVYQLNVQFYRQR